MSKLRSLCWALLGQIGLVSFLAMSLSPAAVGAPVVRITKPQSGQTVSGQTWIEVAYRSDSGNPVEVIQLYVDKKLARFWRLAVPKTEGQHSFSWDFVFSGGTTHTVTAKAIDTQGSEGTAEIIVRMRGMTTEQPDQIPPVVNIYYPAQGAEVSGSVEIKANATDNVGVTTVFFYVDGKIHTWIYNTPPYVAKWDTTTAADGLHVLKASALDKAENQGDSAEVTVLVSNRALTTAEAPARTVAQPPEGVPEAPVVTPPIADAPAIAPASPEQIAEQTFGAPAIAERRVESQAGDVQIVALPTDMREPGPIPTRVSPPARQVATPALVPAVSAPGLARTTRTPKPTLVRLPSAATAKSAATGTQPMATAGTVVGRYAMAPALRNTMPATVLEIPLTPAVTSRSAGASQLAMVPAGSVMPSATAYRGEFTSRVTSPSLAVQKPAPARTVSATTVKATAAAGTPPVISAGPVAVRHAMAPVARYTLPATEMATKPITAAISKSVLPAEAGGVIEYRVAMLPSSRPAGWPYAERVGKPETDVFLPTEIGALRDIKVVFNGELLDLRATPELKAGISVGPLREIFEQTDGVLYWFPIEKQVRAVNKDVDVNLKIGNPVVTVNDQEQELILAPYIKRGRTMVPLQFLADTLDVAIRYNPATGQLVVSSN